MKYKILAVLAVASLVFLVGCSVGECGDGVCDSSEACDTCPEDCGTCPLGQDGEYGTLPGSISVCKDAAAKCGIELATSAATSCPTLCEIDECARVTYDDTGDCAGVQSATDACNKGMPQCIG